ncbi:MAG: PA2779 family protein [Elusimicrobia bacterium]|nr:PA2779 family protein [Elusimicrobiota bacterium]
MFASRFLKRTAVAVAIVSGISFVSAPRLQAMVIPTEVAGNVAKMDRQADMASIQSALEGRVLRQRLADLNLTPSEINGRLSGLSDQQIHKLALQADKQNAAADAGATALIIIAAVALLALIIALLKGDIGHDHHHDDDHKTEVNNNAAPAPAQQPAGQQQPSTIIVK